MSTTNLSECTGHSKQRWHVGLCTSVVSIVACAMLSACATPQSYVDPQYHKATYSQIQPVVPPIPVKIDVQFQVNGQPKPEVNAQLRSSVERALTATRVFIPSTDPASTAVIDVIANNEADTAAARSSGFKTGITFYGSGSTVTDGYRFTFTYRDASGQNRQKNYVHAIHTTIGRVSSLPVDNIEPTTLALAFDKVVEDVTLNFIKNLQEEGAISKP